VTDEQSKTITFKKNVNHHWGHCHEIVSWLSVAAAAAAVTLRGRTCIHAAIGAVAEDARG
jgi:hypothetical protein